MSGESRETWDYQAGITPNYILRMELGPSAEQHSTSVESWKVDCEDLLKEVLPKCEQNQSIYERRNIKNSTEFEKGITSKVKGTWQIKRSWDRVTGLQYWPQPRVREVKSGKVELDQRHSKQCLLLTHVFDVFLKRPSSVLWWKYCYCSSKCCLC